MAQTTVGLLVLFGVLFISRLPNTPLSMVGSALVSGVLFGLSGILAIRVLYSREVSRTVPVAQSAPIFAALLEILSLGNHITPLQWVGMITTASGSGLISLQYKPGRLALDLDKSFYALMLSAALSGAGNVVGKVAITRMPLLFTHGLRMFALGITFLIFTGRKDAWIDVKTYFVQRSPALFFVGINEFITANLGLILLLSALNTGPASLVTALSGTRALFVVAYSTGLGTIWKGALGEDTSPTAVMVKVVSTGLIVAGITAIAI